MDRIKIEIDGKEIITEKGKTILQIAREANIFIPTLCDHPYLKPHGGCRLCLVEIKGMKGFLIACTTPAEDGMEITTNNDEIKNLRKETLRLLLSEHPNGCLLCSEKKFCELYQKCIRKVGITTGCRFCPKDGQCELQKLVENIGLSETDFAFNYRFLPLEEDDPFFSRDYNLCVLCERCVRVCHDIRGAGVLSVYYRGSEAKIGTALGISHLETDCQFCGACVDVCPTGAIYEKQSKWSGVSDKIEESICVLCGLCCLMEFKLKEGKFISSVPSPRGFNEGQACLKGRFLIPYIIHHKKRIQGAYVKINGKQEKVSLEEALDFTAEKLAQMKSEDFSLILSPYLANEDLYVGQKFARKVMGSNSIDSMASLFYEPPQLFLKKNLENIFNRDYRSFVVVGSSPLEGPQVLTVFLRKKLKEGKKLAIISPFDSPLADEADIFIKINPGEEGQFLLNLLNGVDWQEEKGKEVGSLISDYKPSLIIGSYEIFQTNELSQKIKKLSPDVDFIAAPFEGNTLGSFLLGCHPEFFPGLLSLEKGAKKFSEFWNSDLSSSKGKGIVDLGRNSGKLGVLYLCGEFPFVPNLEAKFFIYQGIVHSPLSALADVVLPAATFIETEGTYINFNGFLQKGKKIVKPRKTSRPDWWFFSEIAKRMGEEGFDYKEPKDIFREMQQIGLFTAADYTNLDQKSFPIEMPTTNNFPLKERKEAKTDGYPFKLYLQRFQWSYRDLMLLEEIKDLKRIVKPEEVYLNPGDAEKLGIEKGAILSIIGQNGAIKRKAVLDEDLPEGFISSVADLNLIISEYSGSPGSSILKVKIERG